MGMVLIYCNVCNLILRPLKLINALKSFPSTRFSLEYVFKHCIFGNCIQESLFRNHSMKCCVKMLKIGLIYLSKKYHLVGLKIQLPSEKSDALKQKWIQCVSHSEYYELRKGMIISRKKIVTNFVKLSYQNSFEILMNYFFLNWLIFSMFIYILLFLFWHYQCSYQWKMFKLRCVNFIADYFQSWTVCNNLNIL